MSTTPLHHDERGTAHIVGNELCIDSTIEDAAAVRVGAPSNQQTVGKFSFDIVEPSGRRVELGFIAIEQRPGQGGELKIFLKRPFQDNDQAYQRVLTINTDGFFIGVPGHAEGNGDDRATYLTSPGKTHWGALQDDGSPRIVLYRGTGPEDPSSRPVGVFSPR